MATGCRKPFGARLASFSQVQAAKKRDITHTHSKLLLEELEEGFLQEEERDAKRSYLPKDQCKSRFSEGPCPDAQETSLVVGLKYCSPHGGKL